MSAILKIDFESADEFLNSLRLSNDHWHQDTSHWVFRGIHDANWTLLPHAWRSSCAGNKLSPLIETFRQRNLEMDGDEHAVVRKRLEWEAAQNEALYLFAVHANASGFRVPNAAFSPTQSPMKVGSIYKHTQNINSQYSEVMALAQHHGVPTRLLDWTRNPLIATFFAATSIFGSSRNQLLFGLWTLQKSWTRMECQENLTKFSASYMNQIEVKTVICMRKTEY
jgi:hypothetical protein